MDSVHYTALIRRADVTDVLNFAGLTLTPNLGSGKLKTIINWPGLLQDSLFVIFTVDSEISEILAKLIPESLTASLTKINLYQ